MKKFQGTNTSNNDHTAVLFDLLVVLDDC